MTNSLREKIQALMAKFSLSSLVEQLTIVSAINSNDEQIQANAASIVALQSEIDTLQTSLPVYIYKAVISQSGTSEPASNVLVNTFPDETWAYNAIGVYTVDLGVNLQNYNVTTIQGCVSDTGGIGGLLGYVYGEQAVGYTISTANSALAAADDILVNYTLIIEAYPA